MLVIDALALLALAFVLPGFGLATVWSALTMAAVIGLLNAFVWPLLARFTLPLSVLTLGLSALVLNGLLVLLAATVSPGVRIDGWFEAVVVAVGMAALTALLSSLLAIDDDETWYRNVVRRNARRRGAVVGSEVPGIVFIEIDGLAHDVLRRAMRTGHAPEPRPLALRRRLPDRALGDRLVLADRRLPGRAAARQQRRHAGVPLVGEGPRRGDGDEPPARRRGAREAPVRRARAAVRGRREPRQHPLRRRDALHADDEHGARPAPADRPRLLRLLRAALRRRADARAGDRRPRPRALRRAPPAPRRRPAADRPALVLRGRARVGGGDPARPPGLHRGRRHARRPPRRLHDVPRLRRGRAPLGDRARRHARRAADGRPRDRADRGRPPRHAASLPARRALRPRAVAGRDVPAALRRDARAGRARGVRDRRRPQRGGRGGRGGRAT